MSLTPNVIWAQRKDVVYITIELPDCKEPKLNLEDSGKLDFSGVGGTDQKQYELNMELFTDICAADTKIQKGLRNIIMVIKKKDTDAEHWPRLLKTKGKAPIWLKVDWSKWVDEDEEDEASMDQMDLDSMGGMEQFGQYGGSDDEPDSDDEDLPDLESTSGPPAEEAEEDEEDPSDAAPPPKPLIEEL